MNSQTPPCITNCKKKITEKNQQFFYKNKCRQKVIPLSIPPSAANMSNTKIMLRYGVIPLVFLARLARAWQILVGKVTGKRLEFEQNLRVFDFKNHTNVKNKRLVQMSAVAGVIPARNRAFHQVRRVSTTQWLRKLQFQAATREKYSKTLKQDVFFHRFLQLFHNFSRFSITRGNTNIRRLKLWKWFIRSLIFIFFEWKFA